MGKLEVILEFSLAFDSTKNTLRQRNDSCKYFQWKSNINTYYYLFSLYASSMRKLKKEVIIVLKLVYNRQSATYVHTYYNLRFWFRSLLKDSRGNYFKPHGNCKRCGVKLKKTIYGVILFVTALVNFANIRHNNNQIVKPITFNEFLLP